MQEQLEDNAKEQKRILARAVESCIKRAKIASELLGLNVLLMDEKFMAEKIPANDRNAQRSAKDSIDKLIGALESVLK